MAYKHCGISTAGCDDYACYCPCYRCTAKAILKKEWQREEGHCQSQSTGCGCWDWSTCYCNCGACLLTGNSKHCGSYKCNAYGDARGARACPCQCDCLSCTYSKSDLGSILARKYVGHCLGYQCYDPAMGYTCVCNCRKCAVSSGGYIAPDPSRDEPPQTRWGVAEPAEPAKPPASPRFAMLDFGEDPK